MIFGFNTDVAANNAIYHVQTEDRGAKNPVVDSIVYLGGKIVDQVRTPYIVGQITQEGIEAIVRKQHRELVEAIRSGTFVPSFPVQADGAPASRDSYIVRLLNPENFAGNGEFRFEFSVWDQEAMSPVSGAFLDIRWMPHGDAVQTASSQTRDDGIALVRFPIPEGEREILLLARVAGSPGSEVFKFRVRGTRQG